MYGKYVDEVKVKVKVYLVQISMVKIVEAELKTEVKEDIMAAIITAKIKPFNPIK